MLMVHQRRRFAGIDEPRGFGRGERPKVSEDATDVLGALATDIVDEEVVCEHGDLHGEYVEGERENRMIGSNN